jgi:hypothetical protein
LDLNWRAERFAGRTLGFSQHVLMECRAVQQNGNHYDEQENEAENCSGDPAGYFLL